MRAPIHVSEVIYDNRVVLKVGAATARAATKPPSESDAYPIVDLPENGSIKGRSSEACRA
jgi:hypothetical protein